LEDCFEENAVTSRSTLGKDARLKLAENVHFRRFDDEVIVLDLAVGEYFALNPVASKMWGHLLEGQTPLEVAGLLRSEYDVGPETLTADCVELASQLVERGLLTVVAA
jgi:hypothetical protein